MDYFAPFPPGEDQLIKTHRPAYRAVPDDAEYFFGYFDKSPWNSRQQILTHRVSFAARQPRFGDLAEIGLAVNGKFEKITSTAAWCWQQGSMLQWFNDDEIIFNDFENDRFVSRRLNVSSGEVVRTYDRPIYCLSPDRSYALSLDFARLDRERPGYGYTGVWHAGLLNAAPQNDGIWKIDLESGESRLLFSYSQLREACGASSCFSNMVWVNHLLTSPDGKRFVFLFRWRRVDGDSCMRYETMMFTGGKDGENLHILNNEGLSSHHSWISDNEVLSYSHRNRFGNQYYIYRDESKDVKALEIGKFWGDGHCTFSTDSTWMLTDSYQWPGDHYRRLYLRRNADGAIFELGKFYAPPELPNPARCDLHPRLSADKRTVCFDSVHEGKRGLYLMDVSDITI